MPSTTPSRAPHPERARGGVCAVMSRYGTQAHTERDRSVTRAQGGLQRGWASVARGKAEREASNSRRRAFSGRHPRGRVAVAAPDRARASRPFSSTDPPRNDHLDEGRRDEERRRAVRVRRRANDAPRPRAVGVELPDATLSLLVGLLHDVRELGPRRVHAAVLVVGVGVVVRDRWQRRRGTAADDDDAVRRDGRDAAARAPEVEREPVDLRADGCVALREQRARRVLADRRDGRRHHLSTIDLARRRELGRAR